MKKSLLPFLSAISGAIAVIILALAAHFLPNYLSSKLVNAVTTAGEIQLFHSILLVYLFTSYTTNQRIYIASKFIFWGSLIFSFSIYLLGLNSILMISALKIMGPITPVGGVLMITGWLLLANQFYRIHYKEA